MEIIEYGPQLEVWKGIPSYDNYQASNYGRIKSINRTVIGKLNSTLFRYEKILKQTDNGRGYLHASPYKNNKKHTKQVHVLVAMAFLGHRPDGTLNIVVDHKNNIKNDNMVVNLQLITQRVNSTKDVTNKTSRYVGVSWSKVSKKWLAQIKIKGGKTYLGVYKTEEEASEAYQKALKALISKKIT